MGKQYCSVPHQLADNKLVSTGFIALLLIGGYLASIIFPNYYVETEALPLWGLFVLLAVGMSIMLIFSIVTAKREYKINENNVSQ